MARYNPNESLTENAIRGVDITEPEPDVEDEGLTGGERKECVSVSQIQHRRRQR